VPFADALEAVVVESTYNGYWLVDGLQDAGYAVRLCNPAKADRYDGLKYADDFTDARWLAGMLRLGILPEGYIMPRSERACAICCAVGGTWCGNGQHCW